MHYSSPLIVVRSILVAPFESWLRDLAAMMRARVRSNRIN